ETFQNRSIEQIEQELRTIFPAGKGNTDTDFNAFFEQVGEMIDSKKLILKPISIVLLSDGDPDMGATQPSADNKLRRPSVSPLEGVSRNITVRVVDTDAVKAKSWRDEVPRKRVKIWTQDAVVMKEWRDPKIMLGDKPYAEQTRFFSWVKNNVDFQPRLKRV